MSFAACRLFVVHVKYEQLPRGQGDFMTHSALRLVAQLKFSEQLRRGGDGTLLRTREHLTPGEVETPIEAAKANRYGHRDATMILVAFRHRLRAAEVCDLRWDQIDFSGGVLPRAARQEWDAKHAPASRDELRALRRLQRESPPSPLSASAARRSRRPDLPG